MLSETDLKNAEKKNYLSYFEDGILDIIAGLLVLAFAMPARSSSSPGCLSCSTGQ
jgi:uncharacterized membrane protein